MAAPPQGMPPALHRCSAHELNHQGKTKPNRRTHRPLHQPRAHKERRPSSASVRFSIVGSPAAPMQARDHAQVAPSPPRPCRQRRPCRSVWSLPAASIPAILCPLCPSPLTVIAPPKRVAEVQGFEPRLPGPKPGVLPLDDTPECPAAPARPLGSSCPTLSFPADSSSEKNGCGARIRTSIGRSRACCPTS